MSSVKGILKFFYILVLIIPPSKQLFGVWFSWIVCIDIC